MNNWKNIIFSNWNFMRFLRLGLAAFVLVEAIRNYDVMFGVLASVLLLQAVFNVGCCSGGACYTDKSESTENETKEVIFEEVKSK
jgi:hypothetical protein